MRPAEPLPRRFVARVFERLGAQLGARMADLYAGVAPELVQVEWAEGLAGFVDDELRRGIAACRSRVFAPTLGEFMRLCRPGLDPELAWLEASAGLRARDGGALGAWSHPAVYRAACAMAFELRSDSYTRHKKRWAWELDRAFADGWGEGVPPPAPRLPHRPRTGPPPAVVRERLLQLLARARQECTLTKPTTGAPTA
ncbi:MAG: hypothetical protein V4505_22270 [Pseudomonadota bacterium]